MATLFIGQNKVFLPEVDSTNSYAITLLKNVNAIEGTVVYTNLQTLGKGQRGNVWKAQPSMNITLSIILKPAFLSPKKTFYISKITALAIHDVLADILNQSQFDIKIKWPNDILVNRKKIAGVLIENSFSESVFNWSIVGIGLNINQTEFGELVSSATSVKLQSGQELSLDFVIEKLYSHFEKWYLKLKQNKLDEIKQTYLKHLFGYNQTLSFMQNSTQFNAVVAGVNENGFLQLRLENGSIREFEIKEISFVI